MNAFKFNGTEFKVAKQVLGNSVLKEWVKQEGQVVVEEALKQLRMPWFFGTRRARRAVLRDARLAIKPKGPFAGLLKAQIDQLPMIIQKIGIMIKRKEHKDLYSLDTVLALVVVPRAIAQNEFTLFLMEKLAKTKSLARFKGLPVRIIRQAGRDAECLLFEYITKGRSLPIPGGKAIILGGDAEFGWRLGDVEGHYFCGYTVKDSRDLSNKKDLKTFKNEIEEVLFGQTVHLKRLRKDEIREIADAFRVGV